MTCSIEVKRCILAFGIISAAVLVILVRNLIVIIVVWLSIVLVSIQ